jgi:hypothetical protein
MSRLRLHGSSARYYVASATRCRLQLGHFSFREPLDVRRSGQIAHYLLPVLVKHEIAIGGTRMPGLLSVMQKIRCLLSSLREIYHFQLCGTNDFAVTSVCQSNRVHSGASVRCFPLGIWGRCRVGATCAKTDIRAE